MIDKTFESKLREWIDKESSSYLGLTEVLFAMDVSPASGIVGENYFFHLMTPMEYTEAINDLVKKTFGKPIGYLERTKVMDVVSDIVCSQLKEHFSGFYPQGLWAKFNYDNGARTFICEVPLYRYFDPMPEYKLSKEKLYEELVKYIKEEGFQSFEEFSENMRVKKIKIAITDSLEVQGRQIEFQKSVIQKTAEILGSIKPIEIVQKTGFIHLIKGRRR